MFSKLIKPVYAHCDLMCGVYDPAQARIEAQSVVNAVKRYEQAEDDIMRQRAITIKEERCEAVKQHLWVLWTDYFKPEHAKAHPELHSLIWDATKAAGAAKKTVDMNDAEALIALVDKVGELFAKTKEGYDYQAVVKNLSL